MFKSNYEEHGNISESDEDPRQFKPNQPRFMTPFCHVTVSSASDDDLLVIHTHTTKNRDLKALVDSGATKKNSDPYVREKLLSTHLTFVFD